MAGARPLFAFLLLLPAAAGAQAFAYAPGSAQYRVSQSTKISQTVMGQVQEFETSSNQLMSLTLARAAKDTLAMAIVVDSIHALGSPSSDIVRLRHFDGLTFAEIARELEMPTNTVKTRYYRSLGRLRTLLRPLWREVAE